MNSYQDLWWQQAKSDYDVFVLLRSKGIAQCHSLHYLQMVTEKVAKAYFLGEKDELPKTHAGFTTFLRSLGHLQPKHHKRIARLFAFKSYEIFQAEIRFVLPTAHNLEHLAPALAKDGPNPEYPWPHKQPKMSPANYNFPVWTELTSVQGRRMMTMIENAVEHFPKYADSGSSR